MSVTLKYPCNVREMNVKHKFHNVVFIPMFLPFLRQNDTHTQTKTINSKKHKTHGVGVEGVSLCLLKHYLVTHNCFFSFSMSRSIVHSLPTAYMIQEESVKMYSSHFVSFQSWEVAGVLQVESATLRRQPWV